MNFMRYNDLELSVTPRARPPPTTISSTNPWAYGRVNGSTHTSGRAHSSVFFTGHKGKGKDILVVIDSFGCYLIIVRHTAMIFGY